MKNVKRAVSLLFAVLLITSATVLPAFASDRPAKTPPVYGGNGAVLPQPRSSEPAVDNEPITQKGVDWYQKDGYHSYKIWVENTTSETMTITHTAGLRTDVYTLEANSSDVLEIENHAIFGVTHYLDFATSSGTLSGTVAVRISTVDQY